MRCDYIHCIYYYTIYVCMYMYVVPPLTAEFHIMSSEEGIDSSESLMEAFTPELK